MYIRDFLASGMPYSHLSFFAASGILKGYDPLLNLVLDDTQEYIRGENNYVLLSLHVKCHMCT